MKDAIETSYQWCQRSTRRQATNFYYSFLVLPKAKRRAMCALYAFLRHTDDLGDSAEPVEARRAALKAWRGSLDRALAGSCEPPIFPALCDTVTRFEIPSEYLFEVIQ